MHKHILLFSLLWGCAEPVAPDEETSRVESELALPPLYSIRIQAVVTADSDGSKASPVTASKITSMLPKLNEIYSSTRIRIDFDPATDFVKVNNTLLNQRYSVDVPLALYTDPEVRPPVNSGWHDLARQFEADKHRDKITIFFAQPDEIYYSKLAGRWLIGPSGGGGSSSTLGRSVAWRGMPDAASVAHEIGHYLHQQHPQTDYDTIAKASTAIENYIDDHPVEDGLLALDGDSAYVLDTPADAGGAIFVKANDTTDDGEDNGDKCGPVDSVDIDVGEHTFTLAPDRSLVMSYFKGCPFEQHFSSDQRSRILEATTLMNRRNIFHYLPAPATSSTPILQYQVTETAGPVNDIKITRVGVNRVVTAAPEVSSLKLAVWDIGSDGEIVRRGEIVVGDIDRTRVKAFAVMHGGMRQVIVAYRNTSRGLTVKSYSISTAGNLTLEATETAGGITEVEIARINPITFVTPVRLDNGVVRTITWRIYANGGIRRVGHGDGGVVDELAGVTPFAFDGAGDEDLWGAVSMFVKAGGNLAVQTWKIRDDGVAVMVDGETAGAITSSTATMLDFDRAAAVTQLTNDTQKVIVWRSNYAGNITRLGSYTAGSCTKTASAAIGTRYLATACRRAADGIQIVRLYEISDDGDVSLKHEQESGYALDLALTDVGSNKVVLASRIGGNRLVLKTFAVAP